MLKKGRKAPRAAGDEPAAGGFPNLMPDACFCVFTTLTQEHAKTCVMMEIFSELYLLTLACAGMNWTGHASTQSVDRNFTRPIHMSTDATGFRLFGRDYRRYQTSKLPCDGGPFWETSPVRLCHLASSELAKCRNGPNRHGHRPDSS